MKNIILTFLLSLLCVGFVNAQDNQSHRQLQKLEPFVSAGGLVFIDTKSSVSGIKEMSINEFLSYRQRQLQTKSFISLDKPAFDFSSETTSKWENNRVIIEKEGQFSKIKFVGIRQDIEMSYISFDQNQATVNVKFNDKDLQNIVLKKDSIAILPVGLLDSNRKETNGFLAIQIYDFGFRRTVCSLEDIVNDVINKDRSPICS